MIFLRILISKNQKKRVNSEEQRIIISFVNKWQYDMDLERF